MLHHRLCTNTKAFATLLSSGPRLHPYCHPVSVPLASSSSVISRFAPCPWVASHLDYCNCLPADCSAPFLLQPIL